MARSLRQTAGRSRLSIAAEPDALAAGPGCEPFAERLLRDADKGHVIVPFWSVHQLTIALLADERFRLRPALGRFEIIADDSFGGEIMWRIGSAFGLRMRRIHTRGDARRLEDVAAWLRRPAPFFIAVDGGATYGTIPTGIIRMAARLQSILWPVAVRARPIMKLPGLIADIPMPGAAIALGIGAPLTIDRATPTAESVDALRRRLDEASAAAGRLFEASSFRGPA